MDHGFITKDEEKKGDEGQDVDETEDGDMIESYYCFVLSLKDFTRSKMGIFSKINMVAMYGVCYKSRRAWVQREDDVRSEKHKEKTSESGKLIQKEESRSDSKSVTEETKSRPPDPSGSSQEEQWETVNVSYKGKDCMGNENFTIFDSKVAEFNQHLGEEEMQSLPMSHPTWAEVVANNNRGQCLDIDLVQPQDQYQAREVGVGQLPGSRFAMPVISSAQDPSQVADAGICQQSGLSDPNQAPEPLYNNMEMDSPLVVSSQSLS
ncbi:hypothetical protein V6N11_018185 [Hibiscus sabdariffa]|uniref:Uncharacterized protein n=1 Tax=Hibiscus sabdariffa TaxID=183260 RepID=A0ABR2T6N2_9ROSI